MDRLRYYVQNYYTLKEMELPQPRDTKRDALLQEQKALTAQLEKRERRASRICIWIRFRAFGARGQFVDLKSGLPRGKKPPGTGGLAQIDQELGEAGTAQQQMDLMEKAQELLKLDTLPRGTGGFADPKIEIGGARPGYRPAGGQDPLEILMAAFRALRQSPASAGFGGERSRTGMSELSPIGGSEGHGGCGDEVSLRDIAHVIEPKYPAAVDRYVDLGRFYDLTAAKAAAEEVKARTRDYKAAYARAYRNLKAARQVELDAAGKR